MTLSGDQAPPASAGDGDADAHADTDAAVAEIALQSADPDVDVGLAPPTLRQKLADSSFGILRHRDFAVFWTSALISSAGNWMQLVAVPALMFELTRSAAWVGAVSTAGMVPTLFIVPFAGVFADRVRPRPYLASVTVMQMIVAVTMFVGYQTDHLGRWSLVALLGLNGIASGLLMPAWQIFLPQLVPADRLPDAVRLNSMQFTGARVFGPTAAAVVIGLGSLQLAFLLNALSFVGVLVALIVVRPRPIERHAETRPALQVLREGAHYVAQRRPIRVAVMIAMVSAVLGMSIQQQAASVASQVFGRASTDNAGLVTAAGVGSITAVLVVVGRGSRLSASRMVVVCMAVYALGSFTMGATSIFAVGLIGFMFNGFAMSGTSLTMNTTVLSHAEPRFRGRAISFYLLAVMGGIPLGAMGSGLIADRWSMRAAILGMGVLMLAQCVFCLVTGAHKALDEPPILTDVGVTSSA